MEASWDEMCDNFEATAYLLAYEDVRSQEDLEQQIRLAGGKVG